MASIQCARNQKPASTCHSIHDPNPYSLSILSSELADVTISDKLTCHDVLKYLSQLYNCFRRESMLYFNEFFFRSFVVARVKVHFRFRLVFLILKIVKLTCLSLQTSIWRVFQTFVARAQFHFKLAWKVWKKPHQFHNIFRASDFISLYQNASI